MTTVEERQQQRDDYLVALYDLSNGDTGQWPTHGAIAERAGIPQDQIMALSQFMHNRPERSFMIGARPVGTT